MQFCIYLLQFMKNNLIKIQGMIGRCGDREVFIGFASASLLHLYSYADILNEQTGKGYQRRFNDKHSLDFRKYIQRKDSSSIPLTFNLRPSKDESWSIIEKTNGRQELIIKTDARNILSQVDCQHRLGYLSDIEVPLAFMTYIGLSKIEEMEVFSIINGKAKGLSSSLLDFHDAKLANDLSEEKLELYIALKLNDDEKSPWYKKLDLGGQKTSGTTRRASLRTLQKATKSFLNDSKLLLNSSPEEIYSVVLNYWEAITIVLSNEWAQPRNSMVTKGIGVYSLFNLLGYLVNDIKSNTSTYTKVMFVGKLSDFLNEVDWLNNGSFKGLGGQSGVKEATNILLEAYEKSKIRLVKNA